MPVIAHQNKIIGQATNAEALVKDTIGWTGKNHAYSQTNNAVIADIENGKSYKVRWTGSATITLKKDDSSGETIISGTTSPLYFTADDDYSLYFGSDATVTEIMVYGADITDDTYDPYHNTVEQELQNKTTGHTVKNNLGTSLVQRGNLQFSGRLTATDDSSNDKTVVALTDVWTTPVSCLVGDTDVTISNANIHTTSTIIIYYETTSGSPIGYSSSVVTEGQIVITFNAELEEAANIKLQILN